VLNRMTRSAGVEANLRCSCFGLFLCFPRDTRAGRRAFSPQLSPSSPASQPFRHIPVPLPHRRAKPPLPPLRQRCSDQRNRDVIRSTCGIVAIPKPLLVPRLLDRPNRFLYRRQRRPQPRARARESRPRKCRFRDLDGVELWRLARRHPLPLSRLLRPSQRPLDLRQRPRTHLSHGRSPQRTPRTPARKPHPLPPRPNHKIVIPRRSTRNSYRHE